MESKVEELKQAVKEMVAEATQCYEANNPLGMQLALGSGMMALLMGIAIAIDRNTIALQQQVEAESDDEPVPGPFTSFDQT